MNKAEELIEGRELLTGIFGYWPSFHDAEVINLDFWRGDVQTGLDRYIFPVLTVKIHLWELTPEIRDGYYVLQHHTVATLRFHDVSDFEMNGFDQQNAIFGLGITADERDGEPSPPLKIVFEPACGMTASFQCQRMEVLHAQPVSPTERVVR